MRDGNAANFQWIQLPNAQSGHSCCHGNEHMVDHRTYVAIQGIVFHLVNMIDSYVANFNLIATVLSIAF